MKRFLASLPAILLFGACAGGGGLGQIGDILGSVGGGGGGAQSGTLRGEVQQVDTRAQRIYLRTDAGQSGSLLFDDRTQVVYRQQTYPVTALEPGDVVSVQAQQQGSGNDLYAQRIDVEQSVQERSGAVDGSGSLQQIEGRVGQIDYQRGTFQLQTQYGGTYTVSLPYNPPSATEDRFGRLRTGDSVRLEGEMLGDGRVQLVRFL